MRQRAFIVALGSAAVWPFVSCAPVAMGPTAYFADPGQYEYFSCALLAERHKAWADRELELKAEQASAGTVVSMIAYKGDHVAAREELMLIDEARRSKKCDGLR